jgi:3-methyladenine DNA glycosylase AlkD
MKRARATAADGGGRGKPRASRADDAGLAALLAETRAALARQGDRTRAAAAKRYLKSELEFLGVPLPVLRSAAKALVRAQPELTRDRLLALVERAWASDVHELRSLAIALLELRNDLLTAADLPRLLSLIRTSFTWAYVDWLSTKVLGPIIAREPRAARVLDTWARDDDFWVRRTALLCLHDPLLAGAGDFAHFARLARPMLHEREFFIRKAIGWMLRSTARRQPALTIGFVEAHATELSGLSFREAVRNLPKRELARLTALRARG